MHKYSDFFRTLHDERSPTGYLGRGTHYSILQTMVFQDQFDSPLKEASLLNFSIIWDEDHDERVIEAIELLYYKNLLSPVVFIGERKGNLFVIISDDTYSKLGSEWFNSYQSRVENVTLALNDAWPTEVTTINSNNQNIINSNNDDVLQYLSTINMLWHLGVTDI